MRGPLRRAQIRALRIAERPPHPRSLRSLDLSPRAGERWSRRRCRENCLPNAFDIFQHFIVPETQDAVAMLDEPSISHSVAVAIGVLASVDLEDELFFSTNEIRDVRSDRLLTHEFESAERARTKVAPKLSFGGCRILPQSSGQIRLRCVCATHASRPPYPNPLPARGERGIACCDYTKIRSGIGCARAPCCFAATATSIL